MWDSQYYHFPSHDYQHRQPCKNVVLNTLGLKGNPIKKTAQLNIRLRIE